MSTPKVRWEGVDHRIKAVRRRVRSSRVGLVVWRGGIIVVATLVILVGVVLLALPGPGWLVIFAGLGILATEFEWAARLLRFVRIQVSRWMRWVADQERWAQVTLGVVGLVVLAAVIGAAWWAYF
jgi:uncharacterized protein (TIGR02611 family)